MPSPVAMRAGPVDPTARRCGGRAGPCTQRGHACAALRSGWLAGVAWHGPAACAGTRWKAPRGADREWSGSGERHGDGYTMGPLCKHPNHAMTTRDYQAFGAETLRGQIGPVLSTWGVRHRAWSQTSVPASPPSPGVFHMMIGYARVSTGDQNLDLQIQALERLGCDKIYNDRGVSGAASSRPGLDRAMARLRPGDTLAVWRLDRLGRSLPHLVQLLERLGQREVAFHSVTEHIDTGSSGGRLVFHFMAALAEFERSLISERTKAGMAVARNAGRNVGRLPLLSPVQLRKAAVHLQQGTRSLSELARELGVHPRTVRRGLARLGLEVRAKPPDGSTP